MTCLAPSRLSLGPRPSPLRACFDNNAVKTGKAWADVTGRHGDQKYVMQCERYRPMVMYMYVRMATWPIASRDVAGPPFLVSLP